MCFMLKDLCSQGNLLFSVSFFILAICAATSGEITEPALSTEDLIAKYEQEITVLEPDSIRLSDSLLELGNLYLQQSRLDDASGCYEKSLEIREKLNPESLGTAECFNNMGAVEMRKGDLERSLSFHLKSLGIRRSVNPEGADVGKSLINIGNVKVYMGYMEEASDHYLEAAEILRKTGEEESLLKIYLNLGVVYFKSGYLDDAEKNLNIALDMIRKVAPGSLLEASAYNNLGNVVSERGNLIDAEDYYLRSLKIKEELTGESLDIANTLNNLGSIYLDRKELDKAEQYYMRGYETRRKLAPDNPLISTSLMNLGMICGIRKDYDCARKYYSLVYDCIIKKPDDTFAHSNYYINMGNIESEDCNPEKAKEYYLKGIEVNENAGFLNLDMANAYNHLGQIAVDEGKYDEAEKLLLKSLGIKEVLAKGTLPEAESLNELGYIYFVRGDMDKALDYYQRAVDAIESQVAMLGGGEESLESFLAGVAPYYRDLINILYTMGRKEESFLSLERFRARVLLTMMAEKDLDFSMDAPGELLKEQRSLLSELKDIRSYLTSLDPGEDVEEIGQINIDISDIEQELVLVTGKIKQSSPRLASVQYPQPVSVDELRKALGKGDLFLSYCLSGDRLLIFTVAENGFNIRETEIDLDQFSKNIRLFRQQLSEPSCPRENIRATGEKLSDVLLKPVLKEIKKAGHLIICPDSMIHSVNFSALPFGRGKYLIERKSVSIAVSGTVYRENAADHGMKQKETSIAAFGDPVYPSDIGTSGNRAVASILRNANLQPLPMTREEIERIGKIFSSAVSSYLGEKATEENLMSLENKFSVLHFACHGFFNEHFPLESGLVLSIPEKASSPETNGIVQAWEIFEKLRIDADLVVLSACETGLGKEMGGEGLTGLTRAFHYAGAKSVVASQWQVSDISTAELVADMYTNISNGMTVNEALRASKVRFIQKKTRTGKNRSTDFSHPFYWAAFDIYGN